MLGHIPYWNGWQVTDGRRHKSFINNHKIRDSLSFKLVSAEEQRSMGVNVDRILNTLIIPCLPELIQLGAIVKEAALFSRRAAQTGIAVNAMTFFFQIPDVICPQTHYWMRIYFGCFIPLAACMGVNMNDLGVDTF